MTRKAVTRTLKRVKLALSILRQGAPFAMPSMIRPQESEFYASCSARLAGRGGQIVDLGCFMGSTSIALANGIRRADSEERVLAFDLFEWAEWMTGANVYGIYKEGDRFLPEARRVAFDRVGDIVEFTQADLSRYEWTGEPIKILLVDAMKTPDLAHQIARTFFPSLLPAGVLIHQDFKHYYTPWIHLLQFQLHEYFRFTHSVSGSGTAAFEVVRQVPLAAVETAISALAAISDSEADASFEFSMSLLEPDERVNVAAAHVAHYCHKGDTARARDTAQTYTRLGWADKREFPLALRLLPQG